MACRAIYFMVLSIVDMRFFEVCHQGVGTISAKEAG